MIDPSPHSDVPLQIRKPCPKTWAELSGDGQKRFCSECSLHVHDAGQLTRKEAQAMVSGATSRVCMRFEYDASGAPIFRDTQPARLDRLRKSQPLSVRLARWSLSAAAGLLAACHGSISTPAVDEPADPSTNVPMPTSMGIVAPSEMGDVALPPPPSPPEKMGEMVAVPAPAPAAPPETPPGPGGK